MINALSLTVATAISSHACKSVYASKVNKEADDTVKWNHNYRLMDCPCNIAPFGQLSCLMYSLDHKYTQKKDFFLRSGSTKNEKFTTYSSECYLSVKIQAAHGISHFCDLTLSMCMFLKMRMRLYTHKHVPSLFSTHCSIQE